MPSESSRTGAPTVLGSRYEVLSSLGSGAAADVYRVRDRRTGDLRAAKILKPENATNPETLARFEDEFRILRTLHHPHLPEVNDYGWTDDGGRFLVMELVEGQPLDAYFRAHPGDIWVILYQLCETLTFVHLNNLLHQDIKPSNILVTRTDAYGEEMPLVKLIDFGLTYRRETGAAVRVVGTPQYMAPEVIRGEAPLTRAVDYYSLGATLYELLHERSLFEGTATEVMRAQVEKDPVIDDEHFEWAELYPHVQALLTKDHRKRLEAFEEFRRAIVSRLTGGIETLDKAYGLARIESLPMIGKDEAWKTLMGWLERIEGEQPSAERTAEIHGPHQVGKSFLLDRFLAECSVHGLAIINGRSSLAPEPPPGTEAFGFNRFDGYMRAWRLFEREARSRPLMLLLDGNAQSEDHDSDIGRFVSTQLALLRTGSDRPKIYVAMTERWTGHTQVDSDAANLNVTLSVLNANDRGVLSERFRGEMADTENARTLVQVLAQTPHVCMASALLARSLHKNRLTFSGCRWQVDEDIGSDYDFYAEEVETTSLPAEGVRWSILALIATHPDPVPVSWVRQLVQSDESPLSQDTAWLRRKHLILETFHGVQPAIAITDTVRQSILKRLAPDLARNLHVLFTELLERIASESIGDSRVYLALSHHYEALGRFREASNLRIRVLRNARRRHDYETIEVVARRQMRRHIHDTVGRYCTKQWLDSLWARNQHARVFGALEELYSSRGNPIPMRLVPRYLKGMSDARGPQVALAVAMGLDSRKVSAETRLRLRIEIAFLLMSVGQHRKSLSILRAIAQCVSCLRSRDRLRVDIYRAMNLLAVGRLDTAEPLLRNVARRARSQECIDEHVLANTLRIQLLTMSGSPHVVLGLCAQSIRLAHRYGLTFRRNVLYRLAASAYSDLGDRGRARRYQEHATRLASVLSMPEFEAMSWARLAEYEAAAGNFGNALRYVAKALTMIGERSARTHRTQSKTLQLWLHMWLRSPECPSLARSATRMVAEVANVNEKGRLCLVLGQYELDRGRVDVAEALVLRALELFRESRFVDNQVSALRSLLKIMFRKGDMSGARRTFTMISDRRRVVASRSALVECHLAGLEFHYLVRSTRTIVQREIDACEAHIGEMTDVSLRLEAFSLIIRAMARTGDSIGVEGYLVRVADTARRIVSNVGELHSVGLMARAQLDALMHEGLLMQRRKRGRTSRPAPQALSIGWR